MYELDIPAPARVMNFFSLSDTYYKGVGLCMAPNEVHLQTKAEEWTPHIQNGKGARLQIHKGEKLWCEQILLYLQWKQI